MSPTGKCWLDRNLGASRVATAYNDSSAYGDLFQWGRGSDGHQIRTSSMTTTLSTTDTPGNSNFISTSATPYNWRAARNNSLWQGVSGINNPCPSGWRIPTRAEWIAEITTGGWNGYVSNFNSPLKLPNAGRRSYSGSLAYVGSRNYYWSSNVTGDNAYYLYNSSTGSSTTSSYRSYGYSVRCIKN